jgi:hypothetical protein
MTGPVYHFTDSARMPWILVSNELRTGENSLEAVPFDFLWATASKVCDETASVIASPNAKTTFRAGVRQLVRFTLDADDFIKWSDVPAYFPEWTPEFVAKVELAARRLGKGDLTAWRCRASSLPLSRVIAVETRTYRDNRWLPFEFDQPDLVTYAGRPNMRGVRIGDHLHFSEQVSTPGEATFYTAIGRYRWTDFLDLMKNERESREGAVPA